MIEQFLQWVRRLFSRRPQARKEADRAGSDARRYEDRGETMNFTAIFAGKLARLVTVDSDLEVTGDTARAEAVGEALKAVWRKADPITAQVFGKGGKVIVPYVDRGKLWFSTMDQDRMAINAVSGGRITSCTFLADVIERGERKYYRLTDYTLENGTHRITNRAVSDAGNPVPLADFEEWANIAEDIAIGNVDRLLFAFLKSPADNRTDKDLYGVPITYGSEELIRETLEHLAVIRREYKLTRPMLGLDASLWKRKPVRDENGNVIPFGRDIRDIQQTVQDGEYPFIPVDTVDGEAPWLMFSPAIRDTAMYARLQSLFEQLERSVGTSRGILTELKTKYATATEIKAAMYDTYSIVGRMREAWEAAAQDLAYAFDVLAESYGISPAGGRGGYEVRFTWDMSLYESSSETFSQMSELQSRGGLSKAELRQWVTGGTLEAAQAAVEEAARESMNGLLGNVHADR